jgi:3-oxoacyl-[acyl-carrier protein] reductase
MRLAGKTAIITGAASGFGAGMARRFAAEGAKVVIADLNTAGAERMAAQLGKQARPCTLDVSNGEQWRRLVDHILHVCGGLDIVVNNAGITHRNRPLLEVDEASFDRVFAVNVKSIYHSAQACVPIFRQLGGGSILNIASTAGLRPRPGLTWYNASKGAVITLTKSMALELAPDRIRVNALCPVAGETPLLKQFMGEDTPQRRAQFIATVPLGRFSTPEDIASAALYLCSDEAEFLTGVALEVDGGRCI